MLEGNYTSRLVVSHVDEISTVAKPQPLKHFQFLYPAARKIKLDSRVANFPSQKFRTLQSFLSRSFLPVVFPSFPSPPAKRPKQVSFPSGVLVKAPVRPFLSECLMCCKCQLIGSVLREKSRDSSLDILEPSGLSLRCLSDVSRLF